MKVPFCVKLAIVVSVAMLSLLLIFGCESRAKPEDLFQEGRFGIQNIYRGGVMVWFMVDRQSGVEYLVNFRGGIVKLEQ